MFVLVGLQLTNVGQETSPTVSTVIGHSYIGLGKAGGLWFTRDFTQVCLPRADLHLRKINHFSDKIIQI